MGFYPVLLPLSVAAWLTADAAQPAPALPEQGQIALREHTERLTVPVSIAGAGPYRFIIDTGAQRTVISRQLAQTLGLSRGGDVTVVAMSGISRVGTVIIPSLRLSSVPEIGRIVAPALDAGDLGALGLLGIDTLQEHKVTIDLEAQTMAVSPSVRRTGRQRRDPGEIVVRARSVFGQLIVTDAQVDGKSVRVVIDTGSPVSVGNHALLRLVSRRGAKLEPLEMTSATGGTIVTRFTHANRMRVGGVEFSAMPIAFADVAPFERFGLEKKPAMLLGMNALKFFRRVEIDFPNREVRFQLPRRDKMTYDCALAIQRHCAQ
ncbi:MAG: aspartyl protease family protein [Pseudomonadota bacterium]